uniref:Uncharacterized protein n=1 Tax=Timspurckia oligopyrenoides TaxID=708627 RepID=A0A7S1ERS9_9RHOD
MDVDEELSVVEILGLLVQNLKEYEHRDVKSQSLEAEVRAECEIEKRLLSRTIVQQAMQHASLSQVTAHRSELQMQVDDEIIASNELDMDVR